MDNAHRLVVIRHAKAESDGPSDPERALSRRGRADADAAGAWLKAEGIKPDVALVSTALRTRQTWKRISEAAGWAVEADFDDSLYGGDEDTIIDLVSGLDDKVGTVVVVGHNPTIGMLAQLLDDGDGPADAVDRLMLGYPTAAVTVFDVPVTWARLAPGTATMRAFEVPRGQSASA